MTIQSGKYAVEVAYPSAYSVNVGDAVEVKGVFMQDTSGDVDIIWISTFQSTNPAFDIKVTNETISVETVTIAKEVDLIEYDSSKSSMSFTVAGNRNNAAFVGKRNAAMKKAPGIVLGVLAAVFAATVPAVLFAIGSGINHPANKR